MAPLLKRFKLPIQQKMLFLYIDITELSQGGRKGHLEIVAQI
jgi:hypothetical protein